MLHSVYRIKDIKEANRHKTEGGLIKLATGSGGYLYVTPDDCVFMAALDLLAGNNVMFGGPTGAGKTRRQEALLIPENYPKLLAQTKWKDLQVVIHDLPLDLVPIIATSEAFFDVGVKNGTSYRTPANIGAFLQQRGYPTHQEFLQAHQGDQEALKTGKGTVNLHILNVDDLDRIVNVVLQNVILKDIDNIKHVFNWDQQNPVCYLNLQCLASSNFSFAIPSNRYLASKGIDLAIWNRFFVYYVDERSHKEILKMEFPSAHHDFIDKLVNLSYDLRDGIAEGSLAGLGEISLRQLRPLVEQRANAGLSELQVVSKLISCLPDTSNERTRALHLINNYFGEGKKSAFKL